MPKFSHCNTLKLITLLFLLQGCSSQYGRYQQAHDSTPARLPTPIELKDAVPRIEQKSRGGNKDYTVRGKRYKVLSDATNFSQTGIASWYGRKFHGHLTSNGEIYDMYSMTAAHKNLPLPTYMKVTNLANNKSVVVRVNDRGPFHESRIIDLSYSAAYKIDMLKTGTAKVKIEAITGYASNNQYKPDLPASKTEQNKSLAAPSKTATLSNKQQISGQFYIQVFATKNQDVALKNIKSLSDKYKQNVIAPLNNGIYRVLMGPFNESENLAPIITTLKRSGYPSAFRRKNLQ